MTIRIQVAPRNSVTATQLVQDAHALGLAGVEALYPQRLYFLSDTLSAESLQRLCATLLADPVTEAATWMASHEAPPAARGHLIEVSYRPGVTDIEARELERGMAELGLPDLHAATGTRYEIEGDLDEAALRRLARQLLANETVQHWSLGPIHPTFVREAAPDDTVEAVPLDLLSDDTLLTLSRERLLSLDLAEMKTIRDHFAAEGRAPTDVELETLAQTWSEHCVHKTFRATINFTQRAADGTVERTTQIKGLLRHFLRRATEQIAPDWLHSAFVDNAGIIAFDGENDLAFKVETHNHPSALEPFGGANTGIGGVVRDIIGISARPIATTDVLCFGPQDFPPDELPEGILHPRRIASGVVAGIADYGNKLGLPTVNGAVLYDEGYLGNPLVYCGCVGLLPHGSHRTTPQVGDQIVALGGRTGRDGLHGATFSSAELTVETVEEAGSAVQIGDPITEKGLIELIEAARDEELYSAITDCGAGGFSSAVGEMGAELGVDVELSKVPLKYPGLRPWEIWLSEAQERIVVAVPPEKLARLQTLADEWEVECTVLGRLTGHHRLVVRYEGIAVADMPMDFLHDGLPQRTMEALWQASPHPASLRSAVPLPTSGEGGATNALLLRMLADPNVASNEAIIRRYDHEIRGGSIVRPLVGPMMDGPADAALLKPRGTWGHNMAFTLSNGINPWFGQLDPYRMALSTIDEAIRNAVAVGADPDRIAILDNFCWGNPTYPDRLGSLVRACEGCYDGALAYNTPFISGKDSLYNEFEGRPIPGTLLISAISIVPDYHHHATSAFKAAGNLIYLLGDTKAELGGSLLHRLLEIEGGEVPDLPANALNHYRALHEAIRSGWIAAAHDLSEGGVAVALAEMALAGRLGATVSIPKESTLSPTEWLFSESNGRLLLEVAPQHRAELAALFSGMPLHSLGHVSEEPTLRIDSDEGPLIDLALDDIVKAWRGV
ncbi:MAG: phosphoribosylformylglycinamidine synthase subunit PurL [Anaerolineales bacterium]|nr:phosphoribosylformylglycinamidine synthase subunit PurL [Anaerolineales bacterium]MCB9128522.1 phosphoribosylformylglycinamidine synthase subunit PurL [Ardenticatenales bacterium]